MPFHENTRTSDVMAASRNSTMSDFELDIDGPMASKRPNNKHAGSYRRMGTQKEFDHGEEDLDFAIDTSALHNALPDFSDGRSIDDEEGEEEEDDEEDISIEIGRGGRKIQYRLDDSRDSLMSQDDSRQVGSPARGNHDSRNGAQGTRPAPRNISNRKTSRNGNALRKDAQIRRASLIAQKENIDPRALKTRNNPSNATQQGNQRQRRTLSDMHAKVSEAYDGSYLSDERPPNAHMTTKNTRFGQSKPYDQAKIAQAVNKASSGRQANEQSKNYRNNTWTDHSHQESFLLPDVENLSELVSGIYHDGAVGGTQQTRPRTTRFTSPPAVEIAENQSESHAHFDAIPIPDDEKAIFASLRLLQRKVSSLEKDNADVESKLEELRQENTVLRANQSRPQKDSLRNYKEDIDESDLAGAAKLAVEKNRLEAANSKLQNELEAANQRLSGHESSVHHAKQERNSIVNQLGTVYSGFQELKVDNEGLRRENEELKAHLATFTGNLGNNRTATEHHNDAMGHTSRTKRSAAQARAETIDDDYHPRRQQEARTNDVSTFRESQRGLTRREKDDKYDALFSLDLPSRHPTEARERSNQKKQNRDAAEKKLPNTSRQRVKKSDRNNEDGDFTEFETTMDTRDFRGEPITRDLTYLSFVDSREIAQLRKTLEEERVARKHRRTREEPERSIVQDKFRTRIESLTRGLTKDITKQNSKPAPDTTNNTNNFETTEKTDDMSTGNQDLTSHKEDLTRASSRRGSRPNDDAVVEMTSAFILPDITMGGGRGATITGANPKENVQLSAGAQRALDHAVRHEKGNCTVCKKGGSSANDNAKDHSIKLPKPVPVSERDLQSGAAAPENNGDHTMRPSQPPSIALAKVLKVLEDELAHLKMQLAVSQSRYSRHDAAAGKRKRVKLGDRIKVLMTEIESRSEVVYALYDVLEGQKEMGDVEQKNEEVQMNARGMGAGIQGDGDDEEDDDELPWEGFESTQEDVTGRSRRRGL